MGATVGLVRVMVKTRNRSFPLASGNFTTERPKVPPLPVVPGLVPKLRPNEVP